MRATTDLFYTLEPCIHCASKADCPLSKLRTLPKKILLSLIAFATENEMEIFRNYLLQCPDKNDKELKENGII